MYGMLSETEKRKRKVNNYLLMVEKAVMKL